MHESTVNSPAWFVTLTYDNENLPHNGSLEPADPRNFLKRLRRRIPGRIQYYLCGEYGDLTQRPHYHAVLLGADFPDRRLLRGTGPGQVWTSDILDRAWSHGLCEFSAVTFASCSYVTGYVRKKVRKQDDPDHYLRFHPETGELHEMVPEFARMSRNPAIGLTWLKKYWRDVYPRDHVTVDGRKFKPPRYYDRAMVDPRHKFPDISLEERWELMYDVMMQREADEVSTQVLRNRERNHQTRVNLFKKRDKI